MRVVTRVLLVEDDAPLRELTAEALRRYGCEVVAVGDGVEALERFGDGAVDVVVADVMLPRLDGVSLCRLVRERGEVPVLMVSARSDPVDVIAGLEAGADDYVVKPFEAGVLAARIRAVLRRAARGGSAAEMSGRMVRAGELEVDLDGLVVRRSGVPLALTPVEFRLLAELAAHVGQVLSRDVLLDRVWEYGWSGDSRLVDAAVRRLRAKTGADAIETVRGFGYRLVG